MHTEYKHSNEANGGGLRREGRGGETFAFPLVPSALSAHSLSSFLSWQIALSIERFSFECRKVIGFALSTRCDWLKRFAPPFHPIRSKTKANCDALARFSRALRQPHVITSSFDWFNVLSVSYVIGQSNYFGFGFTTLKRKPL